MRITSSLAAAAALAVGAATSAAAAEPGANFTINATPNPNARINLLTTYAWLYAKYNVTLPAPLLAALQNQDAADGDDEAAGIQSRDGLSGDTPSIPSTVTGGQYLCTVDIGTPPQRFRLNLDTGSADAWVYAASLPASFLRGQRTYDHARSSTSRFVPWEIWLTGYVDFTFVGGLVYKDTMAVGEDTSRQLVVQSQGVQLAHIVSPSIVTDNADMDGILGLGFDSKNYAFPVKQKTWFSNIKDRLSEPLFTVDFRHKTCKFPLFSLLFF